MNQAQFTELVTDLLEKLDPLTDNQREQVFSTIGEAFCYACGRPQPENGYCQCENDE